MGSPTPLIAIVGRPNVGKSTLFNRLLGRRAAVVSTTRGTTRDRLLGRIVWRGSALTLMDTGGMELAATHGLAEAVQRHVRRAVEEADGLLLVCDAREGLVPADELILAQLRKTGKPLLLAVNKCDHRLTVPPDFFALGTSDACPVSALHGLGTGDLLDRLAAQSASPDARESIPNTTRPRPDAGSCIAILGRQNVGKSSLLNALLREERVVVSEVPGTTRDAVEGSVALDGEQVTLIDTAGLRHRRKVKDPIDTFSMSRTLEAIERCDAALVVLDATQGVVSDDQRIVTQVCRAGRGVVLLVNKWDLVNGVSERRLAQAVHRALPFASFAPVIAVSAKTGFRVRHGVDVARRVAQAMRSGLSQVDCARLLREAWEARTPPRMFGRVVRLKRARWLSGRPARVELITNPIGRLPAPYQHYLLKRLHAHPRLAGIPIQLVITTAHRATGGSGLRAVGSGQVPRAPSPEP